MFVQPQRACLAVAIALAIGQFVLPSSARAQQADAPDATAENAQDQPGNEPATLATMTVTAQ